MTIGIVGRKCGMTRVFTEDGDSIPVTVIEVVPNNIMAIINSEDRGYNAVQVAWGTKKTSSLNKPEMGGYVKTGIASATGLLEYRVGYEEIKEYSVGTQIKVSMFSEGQKVDVTGTTIGKGYAGVIKRHHFSGQRNTHGNSLSHRAPGSIGQCQTPGRVFKGKKMAGHMGNVTRTTQNLEIIKVDDKRNLLLIKGAVPGSKGNGKLIIKPAVKTNKGNR